MATCATRSSSSDESSENRGTRPRSSMISALVPFSIPPPIIPPFAAHAIRDCQASLSEKCGGQGANSPVALRSRGRRPPPKLGKRAMRAATTKEIAAAAAASGPGAVGEACREAVEALPDDPGLLLAFTSGDREFDRDVVEMAEAAGDAPHAGMTGKGLFGPDGPLDEGCVAMAFTGQVSAAVSVFEDASDDLRSAGQACTAEAIEKLGADPEIVLLLIESTRGDIADTVSGAYDAAGPGVPLAGGASGGTEKRHFHNGRATSDSIVAVALRSDGPTGLGNAQSCRTCGTPSILTRSRGQTVEEIDGRPAEEVYLEQLGFAGLAFDDDEFETMAITHPIAQPELHGDFRLRHVLGRAEQGSIVLGTGIPESAVIEFTELDYDELVASGAESVQAALDELGGAHPKAALVFDCAGRRRALRDGVPEEVEAITTAMGNPKPPVIGLYTHGEVARLRGAKGDRNHAVVTVAFG